MIYTEHEYLAHHGVDKQKWGHRNGPPYPLDPDQMTSAQKRANANEGWFKRKIREAKEAKQAKKEAKIAKKEEEKLAKQAHKQGRLSEQERKDVYNRADVKTAYEHISEYSNKEIQSIMDRYEMQKALGEKVSNLNYKEKMKGKEKIDIAARYIESAVNIGHKAADIYNIAAGVANALGDKEWKPIRIGEFKRKEETGLTQADKNKIINSGDLNLAYKYRNQMSAKELNNVMNKKNMNNKLLNAIVDPYGRNNQDNKNNQNNQNQKQNNNNNQNQQQQQNNQSYNKPTNNYNNQTYNKSTNSYSSQNQQYNKSNNNSSNIKNQSTSSDYVKNNADKGESWLSSYISSYSPDTGSSTSSFNYSGLLSSGSTKRSSTRTSTRKSTPKSNYNAINWLDKVPSKDYTSNARTYVNFNNTFENKLARDDSYDFSKFLEKSNAGSSWIDSKFYERKG